MGNLRQVHPNIIICFGRLCIPRLRLHSGSPVVSIRASIVKREFALTRRRSAVILWPLVRACPRTTPCGADKEVRPGTITEGTTLVPERCVLVVDGSEETREVLRTALERRGLRILAASRAGRGLELARRHRPDLIVLDLELEGFRPEEICARFRRQSQETHAALVMLGSVRRHSGAASGGEFVSKPYHYGPLIRRIEEILGVAGHTLARCA